jgi:hypothetical protein
VGSDPEQQKCHRNILKKLFLYFWKAGRFLLELDATWRSRNKLAVNFSQVKNFRKRRREKAD